MNETCDICGEETDLLEPVGDRLACQDCAAESDERAAEYAAEDLYEQSQ